MVVRYDAMPLSDSLRKEIAQLVVANKVVLFMKGERRAPACGFSATVVSILDQHLPGSHDYLTVNVLANPELRDGIKEFSSWPTIPQLYVQGAFVGGADIVRELHQSGELARLVAIDEEEEETRAFALPVLKISPAAAAALAAVEVDPGDVLHLRIDEAFTCELFFAPHEPDELMVRASGTTPIALDQASARRANRVSIDFVPTSTGGGFKIDNPNEPPRVKGIAARDLKGLIDKGTKLTVLDVRTDEEREIASLPFARPFDAAVRASLASADKADSLVFVCHHGVRSRHAAEQAIAEGFRSVYNLEGGIEAWSKDVDPSVPRY